TPQSWPAGGWITTHNWAADKVGGIHHDETARSKGFPAGLVTGDVTLAVACAAVVRVLGAPFFERGFIRNTFVRPAYNGEEVRAVVDESEPCAGDEALLTWRLEKRDGSLVSAGIAG